MQHPQPFPPNRKKLVNHANISPGMARNWIQESQSLRHTSSLSLPPGSSTNRNKRSTWNTTHMQGVLLDSHQHIPCHQPTLYQHWLSTQEYRQTREKAAHHLTQGRHGTTVSVTLGTHHTHTPHSSLNSSPGQGSKYSAQGSQKGLD